MEVRKNAIEKITKNTYYLPGHINAGIIRGAGDSCLVVDTGLDKSAANKIASALDAEGLRPQALLMTHTHADHCGGNAALHQKYGMPAYCPPFEASMLTFPLLEPVYLYGAAPPDALMNKFFLAPATPDVHALPPGQHEIGGVSFAAVALPGHSPGHTGYLTSDGVLFCGDAMFPAYVWEKYHLPYFYDIDSALSSLVVLEGMAGSLTACVAAHYGPVDLAELVRANREGLQGLAQWAETALSHSPMSREDVVAAAFTEFGLIQNEAQYYLVGSTVAALLTHLCKAGKAEAKILDGRLRYYEKSPQ
jgi:glyoxylase-like metal-dependent hydrolase (beta-lactamase superfamily II)